MVKKVLATLLLFPVTLLAQDASAYQQAAQQVQQQFNGALADTIPIAFAIFGTILAVVFVRKLLRMVIGR